MGRDGMREVERDWRGSEGERNEEEGVGDAAIDVASLPLDVVGEQVLSATLPLHSVMEQVTQDLQSRVRPC